MMDMMSVLPEQTLDKDFDQKLCSSKYDFKKEEMEDYPDKDYPEGMDKINNPLELLDYFAIMELHIEMYANESVKEVRVLNLSGQRIIYLIHTLRIIFIRIILHFLLLK